MSQQCTEDTCMLLALVLDYSYIRCHHKKYGERFSVGSGTMPPTSCASVIVSSLSCVGLSLTPQTVDLPSSSVHGISQARILE